MNSVLLECFSGDGRGSSRFIAESSYYSCGPWWSSLFKSKAGERFELLPCHRQVLRAEQALSQHEKSHEVDYNAHRNH